MTNVQYDNITAYKMVDLGKVNTTHTIRINCKEEVSAILMCTVDANVFGYECIAGQATYSGKNNVKLVYCDSDGQILSSNSNADFSDCIISQHITPNTKAMFDIVVVDSTCDISGNIVTVQLELEVSGSAYVCDSCPMLLEAVELYTHHNNIEIVSSVDSMTISSDLSCQLTASGDISRVVLADAKISCSDYALLDGVLTVSGDMVVGLMYISEGRVVYDQLTSPYRTELECPMDNGQLTIKPTIKNTRIKLDIVEGQLNNLFVADVSVSFAVVSVGCTELSVVDDCYTANSILELDRTQLYTTLPCGSVSSRVQIEQSISSMDIGQVVAFANVGSTVTNCRYRVHAVSVEGIVCGTLLYSTDTGMASTVVELPFAEIVDIDYIARTCSGSAHSTVLSSSCNYVGGMLVVSVELCIDVISYHNMPYSVISSMTEQQLDISQKSGIEVCMAKSGETLWQLAKAMHMSEQDILDINPDIVSPLERDTKIVIYNRL